MIRAMSRQGRTGVLALLCGIVGLALGWLTIASPDATPALGTGATRSNVPELDAAHERTDVAIPRRLADTDTATTSATDAATATESTDGLVLRVHDALGAPLPGWSLRVVPRQLAPVGHHVGSTDATGRLPTPFVDVAHVWSIRATDPVGAALRTRRSPIGSDVTDNEIEVWLAAWRDVELRFVDTAGHPIGELDLACEDDSRTTPNDRLVLVPYSAIPAEAGEDGVARLRLPEGVFALRHMRTMVDSRYLGWVVVRSGDGPIRGTVVMHGTGVSHHALKRNLRVRVFGHVRESDWPTVVADVPPPRAAEGSFDTAGVVTRPCPTVERGTSFDGQSFTFDRVPHVPVTLRVTCRGCEPVVQHLDATTADVTIRLRSLPVVDESARAQHVTVDDAPRGDRDARVAGVVVDRERGTPIARARVRFHPIANGLDFADGRYGVETRTDANGVFLCSGVFGERWQIEVDALGYALREGVEPAVTLTGSALRFELLHEAPLRVRVRTADGHVVPGLQLAFERDDGGLRTLRTCTGRRVVISSVDAIGRVDIEGVPRDRIWIVVGRDLENRSAPRHRVELDARSIGEEIVDIVVPR